MVLLNRAMLKSCHFFPPQTHNSKAKNHMLRSFTVLPACCLTFLISLHTFICYTIGKNPAFVTDRILLRTGVYSISYSSWFFCLIIFRLAAQCVCFIWSHLSFSRHIWFYQILVKFHFEHCLSLTGLEAKLVPFIQYRWFHRPARGSGLMIYIPI